MADVYPFDRALEVHHAGPIRTPGDSLEWLDHAVEDRSRRGGIMDLSGEVLAHLRSLHTLIRHRKFEEKFWKRLETTSQLDWELNRCSDGQSINEFPASMILAALFPLLEQLTLEEPSRRLPLAGLYFKTTAWYDWYYHYLVVSSPEYVALKGQIRELEAMDWESCRARLLEASGREDLDERRFRGSPFAAHHIPQPSYPPSELTLGCYLRELFEPGYESNWVGGRHYRLSRNLFKAPRRACSTFCPGCELYVQSLFAGKRVCFECWDG